VSIDVMTLRPSLKIDRSLEQIHAVHDRPRGDSKKKKKKQTKRKASLAKMEGRSAPLSSQISFDTRHLGSLTNKGEEKG